MRGNWIGSRVIRLALMLVTVSSACAPGTLTNPSSPTLPATTTGQNPGVTLPERSSPSQQPSANPSPTAGGQNHFDGNHAYQEYLLGQMNIGVRSTGSPGGRATGDYILKQLGATQVATAMQEFAFRGVPIRNVIGQLATGTGPLIILGAHYDTRARANMDKAHPDQPVPGADDGASGVAVLLELARTLDIGRLHNAVWLAFFDAEDNGDLSSCDLAQAANPGTTAACDPTPWPWSVGSSYMADHLVASPVAVIVLDMIGYAEQDLYYEKNSDPELQKEIWATAAALGYSSEFIPQFKWSMTDDHTPFLQRKLRAVDIIDFDYPYWHTTQDTADKISPASLERVGRVMQTWLEAQ